MRKNVADGAARSCQSGSIGSQALEREGGENAP